MVMDSLRATGRIIIDLNFEEVVGFAGNCLELNTCEQEQILAISSTAVTHLRESNLDLLKKHLKLVECRVNLIEHIGGGGIRCMLAGVHLPEKDQ